MFLLPVSQESFLWTLVTPRLLQAHLSQKLLHCFHPEQNVTGKIYHLVHEWSTDPPSSRVKPSAVIGPNLFFKAGGCSSQCRPTYPKFLCTIPYTRELYNQHQGVAEHCVRWGCWRSFVAARCYRDAVVHGPRRASHEHGDPPV